MHIDPRIPMTAVRPAIVLVGRCLLFLVTISLIKPTYYGEAWAFAAYITRHHMQESSRFHPSHFEGRRMRSSASWPSSTISRRCLIHDLANKGSVLEHVESIKPRKLTLNRRKLPKLIRNCRADASGALGILANAYPHLAFSHDQLDEYVESTTRDYSY